MGNKAIVILFLLASVNCSAVRKYWVGGGATTNVDATGNTNWALSDGGANNASVPINTDSMYFTANSLSTTNWNVNLTVAYVEITSGYTNGGWWSGNGNLSCVGNFLVGKSGLNLAINWTGYFVNAGGSGKSINVASGFTMYGWLISGSGSYSLINNNIVLLDYLKQTGGILTTNPGSVLTSCKGIVSTGSNPRTLAFTANAITVTGTDSAILFSGSNLTLTNASNITLTSSVGAKFSGLGKIFGTVNFNNAANTGDFIISGANTFTNITFASTNAYNIVFPSSTTQTIVTLSVNGASCTSMPVLKSSSNGVTASISLTNSIPKTFLELKDINKTGAGSFSISSGRNGGNNFGVYISNCSFKGLRLLNK